MLHRGRGGHHARRALPRLLLRAQPLHSHQGGQKQVSLTVSRAAAAPVRAVLAHLEPGRVEASQKSVADPSADAAAQTFY